MEEITVSKAKFDRLLRKMVATPPLPKANLPKMRCGKAKRG